MDAHLPPVDAARSRSIAPNDPDGGELHALFRTLADGESHTVDELSRTVAGDRGPIDALDRVDRDLRALAAFGLVIETGHATIRTARCVALDARSIESRLRAATRRPDATRWQVRVVFATDSTNDDLLAEVRGGSQVPGPSLLATEIQRKGRGRLGRTWISAPGASLTVSFALRIPRPLAELDGVTLACGLAVHDVLATLGAATRLKWPNDILLDGRKLAGILVEAHATRGGTTLVIGVGINLAAMAIDSDRAPGVPSAGAALLQETGAVPIDRNELAALLALSLEAQTARFATSGFAAFADRWNAVDAFRDRPVTLTSNWEPALAGVARGVDEAGALLLDVVGGRRRIIAGDVSLRLAPPAVECPPP